MADPRTIRQPQFLGDARAGAQATPASFSRVASPRAAPLRVVTSAPPAPLPLSTPGVHLGAPLPPASPPAVLAGMLPTPSAPGPYVADTQRRLEASVERLRLETARLADQARADALEIGFQVARRILEQELTSSPEALFSLVRSAVRRLGDARRLVIKLHPADAEQVDTPDGRTRLGLSLMQVEVTPDASLERGDCVIESEQATVDGRLATRLDELKRAADGVLEEPES